MKTMRVILTGLLLCLAPSGLEAACTGSGLTWSCDATSALSDIRTAMFNATDGATITLGAGDHTWTVVGSNRLNLWSTSKALTIICATAPPASFPWGAAMTGGCNVTMTGPTVDLPTGSSSKLYRFSGINFIFTGEPFKFCPGGTCAATDIRNFRFDHNTMTRSNTATGYYIQFHDGTTQTISYEGLMDHNRFITPTAVYNVLGALFSNGYDTTNGRLAGSRNMFMEDNSFELTGSAVGELNAGVGCVDWGAGFALVFRNNTSQNCRYLAHGEDHGWGPGNTEVYRNTLDKAATSDQGTYRIIHFQGGGTGMVWGNTVDSTGFSKDFSAIALLQYRAFKQAMGGQCDGTGTSLTGGVSDGNRQPEASYEGYPCYHQSGRDWDTTLRPFYSWSNRYLDGTLISLVVDAPGPVAPATVDYTTTHMQINRDYYREVSTTVNSCAGPGQTNCTPFTGATGVGVGPLSGRPDACTANAEAADAGYGGVAYWATDLGVSDRTTSGADGLMFRCTATNTWTSVNGYVPYTYPHPLIGDAGTPTSPANITVS